MLSREELRLINEILGEQTFEDKEKVKLQSKLSLICEQLDVMEKAQKDAAEIQNKIVTLDGDKDGKEEE